jgi:hypothetical protein
VSCIVCDGDGDHLDWCPETARCDLCGERIKDGELAEMFDPTIEDSDAVVCHAQCGLSRHLEVA